MAGILITTSLALGIVRGPLVGAIGGVALMTFGRALSSPRPVAARAILALAVVAGAVGVPALRWGTLGIDRLRGVQSVLGPSVAVGPEIAAAALGAAALAAVVALALWLEDIRGAPVLLRAAEAGAAASLLATCFLVIPGVADPLAGLLTAGIAVVVAAGAWLLAVVLRAAPGPLVWTLAGIAAAGTAVAALGVTVLV